ncbi:MAG: hypothetical protein NC079_08655 [Clostridium sp.]|nr:hypothetical protein [Acetatifactor muris]MCM1527649.1 hypothetical protein [Bacteroides sp.]MCM1563665.1 hypothetical protein [Clostridium sp.]
MAGAVVPLAAAEATAFKKQRALLTGFVHILFIFLLRFFQFSITFWTFLCHILMIGTDPKQVTCLQNFFIIYAKELKFLGILPFQGTFSFDLIAKFRKNRKIYRFSA